MNDAIVTDSGVDRLLVCLCDEDAADLRNGGCGMCDKHAATKLAALVRQGIHCVLYTKDEAGNVVPMRGEQ